jgi:hypothetical protein
MDILNWLLRREQMPIPPKEEERINEALARITAMNPRLRMVRRYRERLAPAVAASLQYADELVASFPEPHEASANAWSSDPYMRAFFATPNDLACTFGRSDELRAHFDRNPDSQEAYATLGMAMAERHVLGVVQDGDMIRRDVAQTTICFGDHRVRICGRSEADLRREIGQRVVDELALEGLARLVADRRELFKQGRELLQARVALLQRQGAGMRFVAGGGPVVERDELAYIQTQIEENARDLAALRVPTHALELELERVREVLSQPAPHIFVTKRRLRLDLMNVVREESAQTSHEIEFDIARIPGNPPQMRVFVLVKFPRIELRPGGLNFDAAMQYI